ncbi:MAG: nucleotidyltransferase family protein [Phycisphaerales bacterium]
MIDLVHQNLDQIRALCRLHGVRRLFLFGSAAGGGFDTSRSDLDFLVQFEDQPRSGFDDVYFRLHADLEALLGRPVDLIEACDVQNPYFIASINRTKQMLYAA